MDRTSFAAVTAIVIVVFLTPAIIFAALKYQGLDDVVFDYSTQEGFEEEQIEHCGLRIEIGTTTWDHVSSGTCGAIVCDAQQCGVHLKTSDLETTFLSNPAIETRLVSAYERGLPKPEPEEPEETAVEAVDQNPYQYPLWQWLAIFSVAVTFSTIGVASSLAVRNRTILGLTITGRIGSYFVVYFFSALSGVLIVCIFAGGLIQGEVFPVFTGDVENFGFNSWSALKFRGSDWFKLALWAYISGFYERFLPETLDRIVQRTQDPPAKPAGGSPAVETK